MIGDLPPTFLVNVFAAATDLGISGLDLGLGVRNLLGIPLVAVQPHQGGHAALPYDDFAVQAGLTYRQPL